MLKRSYKTTSPKFKFNVVLEALRGDKTDSEIARQNNTHPQLVGQWKRYFLKFGEQIFSQGTDKKQEKRIAELEKIIGQQTIEIQFLKKVLNHQD